MNIWCNSASDWMNMQAWDRCGDDGLKLADFAGCEAIAALDLATKKDIASRILLIERDGIVNLFARHYCPVETVESGENASYAGWVEDGWLTATPGPVISQDRSIDDLIEDSQIVDLQEAVFDKWQGGKLMGELDEEGLIVVDLANNVANMSEAMKELEALVLAGTLRHQNDPVLTWMVSNVVCFLDEKDNIFPRKETKNSKNKIDAAVAAIMGLNRLMARRESQLVSPWDLDPNFTIGRV
jgi:phage terminase large subunit-like protein